MVQDFANTLPSSLILGNKVVLKIAVTDDTVAEISGKTQMTDAEAKEINASDAESADIQALLASY